MYFEWFIAFSASFALTSIMMPFFIVYFTNKKLGQMTREEGPDWHEVKSGTPTMGGIAFVLATTITYTIMMIYKGQLALNAVAILMVLFLFGTIGFLDDFLKLIRQHNEGLTSKQKFIGQIVVSVIYVLLAMLFDAPMIIHLPFITIENPILYALFAVIWMTGFSNAVNLTDGLDGLVAGTATIAFGAYAIIAYQQNQYDILLFCMSIMGGLIGFFMFNKKPARIFMGDVGSLALGGAFAIISLLLHVEWSLLLIGVVFVLETVSVILQVGSYKLRGKRVFKMSPIHHHFEMSGWSEWRVVLTFWFIGLCGAMLYFILF